MKRIRGIFGRESGVTREEDRVGNPGSAQQRGSERRNRIESIKSELSLRRTERSQISRELQVAKAGADSAERIEQLRRRKNVAREIFRLQSELRAVRQGAEDYTHTGALPDFAIIGAAKCGTTFLYHLLTKHPYVEPAAFKEPHYFDLMFDRGTEWYRQVFPSPRLKGGRKTITGEASPSYLAHHQAPERMAEFVPRARLIALLRNPSDKIYSAYHHQARHKPNIQPFGEIVEASLGNPRDGFLSQGVYVDQLRRWSRFFGEDQLLVLKSEDFFERPRETATQVLGFLGLPDWEFGDSDLGDKRNKGGYEQDMDPAIRRRLEDYFRPHNQRLYQHLGVDLGW